MAQIKSRKLNRLTGFNYSTSRYYYVTICTYNKTEFFGSIINNKMVLNQYGDIANEAWKDLPNHHKNIQYDEFIVMPNHVHGIIIIKNPMVGAGPAQPSKPTQPTNLSTIIGSYKSRVTKDINRIKRNVFKWQRSFYDHIIRNDSTLDKIRNYIINNPAQWENDENNLHSKDQA